MTPFLETTPTKGKEEQPQGTPTMQISNPLCSGEKVGDVVIYGANHSYTKWRIVAIKTEADGFKVKVLERIEWNEA